LGVTLLARENTMQERVPPLGWEGELGRWLAPFLAGICCVGWL
jgi:hypothetical protein